MIKIPILLSALSLASVNSFALAGDNISSELETRGLAKQSVVANQNVAGLNFTQFNLAIGQLDWTFQYEDAEGRTFSRYIMTSFNIQGGVTEEEADQHLATLGDSDYENWMDWQAEFSARDGRYTKGKMLSAPIAWSDPLRNNRSDLIYYAIEYKNWNNPSVEPVWYRGKLDYRACAHSPNLSGVYGNICSISLDPATNQYKITPNDGTLSFTDELIQIARESYLDWIREQIEGLEKRKADGDESYKNEISGVEYSLESSKRSIEKMHATEWLADEISDLEQRLEKLRQDDVDEPGGDQGEAGDNNGSDDGDGDDAGDTDSNGDDKDNGSKPATGDDQGTNGGGSDNGGSSNNDSQDGKNDSAGDLAVVSAQVSTSRVSNEYTDNGDGSEFPDYGGLNEIDDRSGIGVKNDVEVPNLGGNEPWLKRHLWVLLLPVSLIMLVIIILAKQRKNEE